MPADRLQPTMCRPYFGYGILLCVTCIAGLGDDEGGERKTRGGGGITGRAGGCAIGRTRPRLSVALATTRPVLRASQQGLDGVGTFPRAVSLVAFVGPRTGDGAAAGQRVPLRQRMRAALQLFFGPQTAGG